MQNVLTILLFLICFTCFGQETERIVVAHEDPFDLYANFDKDSATLFYEKLVPKSKPAGVLVILSGSGFFTKDYGCFSYARDISVPKKNWHAPHPVPLTAACKKTGHHRWS